MGEQLFQILSLDMVPVVYGNVDYESLLPPASFINLKDFESLQDLAYFLNYVSKNPQIWLEYFQWRNDSFAIFKSPYLPAYCELCDKLLSTEKKVEESKPEDDKETAVTVIRYHNIYEYWVYGNDREQTYETQMCKEVSEYIPTFPLNEQHDEQKAK
jgi:hypothetical protein